jgi:multicomponent Na+:H+ antiporter subunit E
MRLMVVFLACCILWLVLSGSTALLHILFGAAAAALVTWMNRGDELLSEWLWRFPGMLRYAPWLFAEIVKANLQVARLVLDPRLPIDPVIVTFDSVLTSPLARTTFANSITLTPGTITLDVDGSSFTVHAITEAMSDLSGSAMERRVAAVFGEPAAA